MWAGTLACLLLDCNLSPEISFRDMFGAGQLIALGGLSSQRLSVRTLELPPALKQSFATPNIVKKRILIPNLRHSSVREFRHSAVKESKYSGEFSMKSQREAIQKTMNPEAFKVLKERTAEINDFQVLKCWKCAISM